MNTIGLVIILIVMGVAGWASYGIGRPFRGLSFNNPRGAIAIIGMILCAIAAIILLAFAGGFLR